MLSMMTASAAALTGCAARPPVVPLTEVTVLPVANVDSHYLDPRDIERRAVTIQAPAVTQKEPDLTQVIDRAAQDRFRSAMGAMNLTIHKSFENALIDRLQAAGVRYRRFADEAAAAAARNGRHLGRLAGGADAVVDVQLSSLGYRPILRAPALTPEVYVELDVIRASDSASIDGAKYSYDWRQIAGEPRHFHCPDDALYKTLGDLMADLPRAAKHLEAGALRLVDKVADDITRLYRGEPLV